MDLNSSKAFVQMSLTAMRYRWTFWRVRIMFPVFDLQRVPKLRFDLKRGPSPGRGCVRPKVTRLGVHLRTTRLEASGKKGPLP